MIQLNLSRFRKIALIAFTALLLASCGPGGGGSDTPAPTVDPVTGDPIVDEPEVEVLRIGNGSGDGFVEGVLNATQTALNAGELSTIQVNVVNQEGNPPTGTTTLTFSSVCVSGALASFDAPVSVTPGLTSITYTAEGCAGDDIITATLFETGETASITLSIQAPEVLTVSFVSTSAEQLSLAGIGGNESAELSFKVSGPQGVPIIGDDVTFSINTSVGGASILAGRETATTDNDGLVRTILNSGTVAGPVSVLAVHDATGIQGLSDDIIISTGVAVSSRFSLSYNNFNPANAFNADGITVSLTILASDQFGNNPTDGTRVSFVAPESGNIENSCELLNGTCQVTWRSSSPRPADLRIELIAYTDGAEDYVDNNGNSVFDGSDGAVTDLGEPYADVNEDGNYDLGEFFFDTNENGVRDTGNGLWDGPCLELADASAVCTGESSTTISKTVTVVMSTDSARFLTLGTFPASGTPITVAQANSVSFSGIIIADSNTVADSLGSNPMPFGTSVVFSVEGAGATLQGNASNTIGNTTSPTGPYGATVVAAEVDPADPLPATARLLLTITVPSGIITQAAWPLDITR